MTERAGDGASWPRSKGIWRLFLVALPPQRPAETGKGRQQQSIGREAEQLGGSPTAHTLHKVTQRQLQRASRTYLQLRMTDLREIENKPSGMSQRKIGLFVLSEEETLVMMIGHGVDSGQYFS